MQNGNDSTLQNGRSLSTRKMRLHDTGASAQYLVVQQMMKIRDRFLTGSSRDFLTPKRYLRTKFKNIRFHKKKLIINIIISIHESIRFRITDKVKGV